MEKSLNLTVPGVTELGKEEMRQTNGGWMRLVYYYLAALAAEVITEGMDKCIEDFKEGFDKGYNN